MLENFSITGLPLTGRVPGSMFDLGAFNKLALIATDGLSGRLFYAPPPWRPAVAPGQEAPAPGTKLLAGTPGAARRAFQLARRLAPSSLSVNLNCVHPGVSGRPTRSDICGWRGIAVELPTRFRWDPARSAEDQNMPGGLLPSHSIFVEARLEPIYIIDVVSGRYFAFFKADKTVPIDLGSGTRHDYDDAARVIAGAVGGNPVALEGTIPMPGACAIRLTGQLVSAAHAENSILSISVARGRPMPTYGSSCFDFHDVAERIAAVTAKRA